MTTGNTVQSILAKIVCMVIEGGWDDSGVAQYACVSGVGGGWLQSRPSRREESPLLRRERARHLGCLETWDVRQAHSSRIQCALPCLIRRRPSPTPIARQEVEMLTSASSIPPT
ncbi:hypothetical protein LSTR_LSTR017055 [Laodelphax striatellus]|uniref:Uncharacterized protein n=1 Tax=Laodelphax striatellus TaxID=195883 RepID=A0A482XBZ9_LAOST|nr:hypothetical protein LSTR_LSTR017055 [Laodelphax striatellus]